jgi:hypothetical protein
MAPKPTSIDTGQSDAASQIYHDDLIQSVQSFMESGGVLPDGIRQTGDGTFVILDKNNNPLNLD